MTLRVVHALVLTLHVALDERLSNERFGKGIAAASVRQTPHVVHASDERHYSPQHGMVLHALAKGS